MRVFERQEKGLCVCVREKRSSKREKASERVWGREKVREYGGERK